MSPLADPTYSRVREKLREDIVSGYFPAGKRLKIAELVSRYGVSQMPIREALQQLQGEGLIIIEPNRGAHVRTIDQTFLENMYDIREVIEVYLTIKSIANLTEKDIKELTQIHQRYDKAAGKKESATCLALNRQFHSIIYKAANNPEGVQILEKHWQLIHTMRLSYGYAEERLHQVVQEHEHILQAIIRKDLMDLERATRVHCLNARADLIDRISLK